MTLPPHIAVDGVQNFREVAGLATPNGPIRAGRLYRSGSFAAISDAGLRSLRDHALRAVIDLRSNRDISGYARPELGSGVELRAIPVASDPTGTHPVAAALRSGDRDRVRSALSDQDSVREWMCAGYRRFALHHTGDFARVLELISETEGAITVNCAAGKDRTGWAIALALLAVGVSEADLLSEYLLTNRAAPRRDFGPELAELVAPLTGVRADYLRAGLDAAVETWTSLDRYFTHALGVDEVRRARLRARLVEV
jgi:protein-tyrosine phosphatase